MDDESEPRAEPTESIADDKELDDEAVDVDILPTGDVPAIEIQMNSGAIRTLDGEIAGDELEGDAINYQILLGKIDALLDRLKLDA